MKFIGFQNGTCFSEIDFSILFLSCVSKNGHSVINIDSLEKKLFSHIKDDSLVAKSLFTVSEQEKRINLKKSFSFLETIGSIFCYKDNSEHRKCAIMIDDKESDFIIENYRLLNEELVLIVDKLSQTIYPSSSKSSIRVNKHNMIKLFNSNSNINK